MACPITVRPRRAFSKFSTSCAPASDGDVRCESGTVVDVVGAERGPAAAIEVQGAEALPAGEQPIADDAEETQPLSHPGTPPGPPLVGGQVATGHGVVLPQGVEARSLVQLVLECVDLTQRIAARGVRVDAVAAVDDAHSCRIAAGQDLRGDRYRPLHSFSAAVLVLHPPRRGRQFPVELVVIRHQRSMTGTDPADKFRGRAAPEPV